MVCQYPTCQRVPSAGRFAAHFDTSEEGCYAFARSELDDRFSMSTYTPPETRKPTNQA